MTYWTVAGWMVYGLGFILVQAQPVCHLESSDLADIVNTPCFVDKTLMIEDLLNSPRIILLTAPRRFGKSTNLNTIKRFFEITVDENGNPKDKTVTPNYKLFAINNLNIFKSKQVLSEHFGTYPVLSVDYSPLEKITDFEITLAMFRQILLDTFEQHMYLIENKTLWENGLSKEKFIRYIHPKHHLELTTAEIKIGFKVITELLFKHFGKKVVVLVDGYDSHVENLLFQKNPDMDIIFCYINSINNDLLKSRTYVDRVILSGVLRTFQNLPAEKISDYYFLGNHSFSQYYGLTSQEVSTVSNRLAKNANKLEKVTNTITEYYKGYNAINQNLTLYSTWSVLNYLYEGKEVNPSKLKEKHQSSFQFILNLPRVSEQLESLLLNNCVCLDVSKSFSSEDLIELNDFFTSGKITNNNTEELFLLYLYQLGYLSPVRNIPAVKDKLPLTLPNKEVCHELKGLLIKYL